MTQNPDAHLAHAKLDRYTPNQPKPRNPLRQLRPEALEQRVPEWLRKDPLTLFDRPDPADDVMSDCLELYIARVNLQTSSDAEARSRYLDDRPGSGALLALLRKGDDNPSDFLNRSGLLRGIALCLVAENDTDALWQWVRLGSSESSLGSIPTDVPFQPQHVRFRSQVLVEMMAAQVHWTTNPDFTADALTTALVHDRSIPVVARRASFAWLVMLMYRSSGSCKNVEHYDRFRRRLQDWFSRTSSNMENHFAKFDLAHPSRPSATRYLAFLRNDKASAETARLLESWFFPTTVKQADGLRSAMYRIINVCMLEGRQGDAHWVLDFAYDRRPELFGTWADSNRYTRGLKSLHSERETRSPDRKATRHEIEAGIETDQAGYVTASRLNGAWRATWELNHVAPKRSIARAIHPPCRQKYGTLTGPSTPNLPETLDRSVPYSRLHGEFRSLSS